MADGKTSKGPKHFILLSAAPCEIYETFFFGRLVGWLAVGAISSANKQINMQKRTQSGTNGCSKWNANTYTMSYIYTV